MWRDARNAKLFILKKLTENNKFLNELMDNLVELREKYIKIFHKKGALHKRSKGLG
jgi:5-bromo-4-chloroindolyl phosphate hydrolysis protein